MRDYVARIRAVERSAGPMPPIYLATLRDKMLDLALEVADGAIWANASLRHMPTQLARIESTRPDTFFLANMVPTVIDADRDAARAIHRRTLVTLHHPPELPQLLEAGRLRGGDGGDRGRTRGR